jgi:hypothetical protein
MSSTIRSRRREAAVSRHGWLPRHVAAAALAALVGLGASAARAEVSLFSVNTGDQSFTTTGLADLNGAAAGGTSLSFTTTQAKQRVVIIFDATCSISAASGEKWAVITILVDPAGPVGEIFAPPTNSITNNGVVVCYQGGAGRTVGRISVVASARPDVAGTSTVKVQVRPVASPETPEVRLQATSLAVMR